MNLVLFYVVHPSHFRVLSAAATLLASSGRWQPVFVFDEIPLSRDLAAARNEGWRCVDASARDLTHVQEATDSCAPAISAGTLSLRRPLSRTPLALVPQVHRHRARMTVYRKLLAETAPALVLLPGDSVSYRTPELVRAAHERGIPVGIVPFTVSNADEVVADLKRDPANRLDRLENRLAAWLYPRWAIEHQGHRLVRLPGFKILAMEWCGTAPPLPWILHSGSADSLAVESPFMMDHYTREGLPVEKYRLVGSLTDDVLTRASGERESRKRALENELLLPEGRPLFVFAVSNWSAYFRPEHSARDFAGTNELTRFWSETLGGIVGWNTVLNLHPSLRYEDWRQMERPGVVAISQRRIEELIPLCDVYLASISATVRMAIACGKPVIDHDVFAFRYRNFVGLDGVQVVESAKEFRDAVNLMAGSTGAREESAAAVRRIASCYGMLDGKVSQRMLAWVDELVERRTK